MLIQGNIKKIESKILESDLGKLNIPEYYVFEIMSESIPKKLKNTNFDGVGLSPYEAIQDSRKTLIEHGLSNAVLEVKIV